MTDIPTSHLRNIDSTSPSALSPAAANQLGILRAWFGFQAYGGIVGLAVIPFARFLAPAVNVHGKLWVAIPLLAVNTWAAFRTRRLLRERDPDGAWMAGAMFGWNLIVATTAGHFGFGALLRRPRRPARCQRLWRASERRVTCHRIHRSQPHYRALGRHERRRFVA